MDEDPYVTQIGGRQVHRGMKLERCANGYVVKYKVAVFVFFRGSPITEVTRVFTNNADLLEFIEDYFKGSPGI